MKKMVIFTSTLPVSDTDPVPAFIKDQAIWIKKLYPHIHIDVLAPHNAYSDTKSFSSHEYYDEYRFHYFWPHRWEKVAGRGIQPALKQNKFLYLELPFLFIGEFWSLWKFARKHRPDLIFASWFTPQAIVGALVSKMTGAKFTFDSQASDVIVLKWVPFAKKIVAAVCGRAYAYTVPSQQTADKLLYFATDKNLKQIKTKLYIIPLGTVAVPAKQHRLLELQKKYGLRNKIVILFIGRLVYRKGVDLLIEAFAALANDDTPLKLVIAGDGQERENLEKQAAEKGLGDRVVFAGYAMGDDKSALLSLADVVALPSRNEGDHAEGLPVAFMEAISHGKATVVSDVTGAHEVVTDGQNGYIFKEGSVLELKEKLRMTIRTSQEKDERFYKAVNNLAKKFQWPAVTKKRAEAMRLDDI